MNSLEKQWQVERYFAGRIGDEVGKYKWDLFLTVTCRRVRFEPEAMLEPGRYLNSRYCPERSIWMVEPFKLAGFHLHGLMYFENKIRCPNADDVRRVCNKQFGKTDVQEVVEEKGGSIGAAKYVSKFSGNGDYMLYGDQASWDLSNRNN